MSKNLNHWSLKLLEAMENPSQRVLSGERCIVIKDKFPKAEIHYLVLAKEDIPTIFELKPNHISLLDEMESLGLKSIENLKRSRDHFQLGYHFQPSMQRLHLHVISKDFNSPALKTKKHWNSFTTDFFIPSGELRDRLQKQGKIGKLSEEKAKDLLSTPLKCNACSFQPKNIPNLKSHLLSHLKLYKG